MATEVQNHHNVSWGKDFKTDAGIDAQLQLLNATKGQGISGDAMDGLLSDAMDYDQVTEREYSAMKQWVGANFASLSPEAKAKWAKFDAAMQEAGGKGTAIKHHSSDEAVILSGQKLLDLKAAISEIGKKPTADAARPPAADGCDLARPEADRPPQPRCADPAPPPATLDRPEVTAGSSWGSIFAMILDILMGKEKDLKDAMKEKGDELKKLKAGGGDFEVAKGDLVNMQNTLQQINQMFTMVTNMMSAVHETNKAGIQNLRV